MNKFKKKGIALLFLGILAMCVLPFAYTQKEDVSEVIDGFKVTKITDSTARVRIIDNGEYVPLEVGKVYKFPVTLKSNKAQVFLSFTEDNTARLLPNTVLQLTSEKVKHPKLKLLTGNVALELDKFPKDHKIEVSTPTAVCGAVGTRFEVSYSGEDKQLGIDKAQSSQAQSFACSKGEIYVASNSFHIGSVKVGQAVTTQSHEGKENSYCAVALENKSSNSFHISLPDKSEYVASTSSFEIAQPKDQPEGEEFTVVKVKDNNLKTLGFFETSATGLTVNEAQVKVGDTYVKHVDFEAYLMAAKEEGRLDTSIKEKELQIALLDDVDKNALKKEVETLEVARDEAAKKASEIAKRITQDRVIRNVMQQIRRNINRQQMRSIKH